jgi:hypothetical protein
MGLDFASAFQMNVLEMLPTDEGKSQVLNKMLELLRQSEDGALFGYDKLSFVIDHNLNQLS